MPEAIAVRMRADAPWALAALAAGAVAAAAVVLVPQGPLPALAAVAALAVAGLALWRLEWGIVGLLFTLPLDVYGRLISEPMPVTVFQLVLLVCLGSWALRIVAEGRTWLRFSAVDVGAGLLVVAGLASLPASLAPQTTAISIVRVAVLWSFALMYANVVRDETLLRRAVWTLSLTGVGIGFLALAQYFVPGFSFGSVTAVKGMGGSVLLSRAAGFFEDPNFLAGFLSAVFVASFAMLVHSRTARDAVWWTGASGVTGLALLVTFSRTGWVGAALGLVVVVLTAPKDRRLALVAASLALVALVAVAAPEQVFSRAATVTDVDSDRSVATRYYMFYSTAEMIRDDWVVGTGLGAFDRAYPAYRYPGTLLTILKPHQLPLALWAEMGVTGLIAEVVLVGSLIVVFWRRRPGGWTPYEVVAAGGLVTLLAQTLFQYYLYFEYVWLFMALAVVSTRLARAGTGEAR